LLSRIAQFDQPAQFNARVQGSALQTPKNSQTSVGLISTSYRAVKPSGLSLASTSSFCSDSTAPERVNLSRALLVAAGHRLYALPHLASKCQTSTCRERRRSKDALDQRGSAVDKKDACVSFCKVMPTCPSYCGMVARCCGDGLSTTRRLYISSWT
jgi:hypothetical protein